MRLAYVTLRSGRHDRFHAGKVRATTSATFERWLARQEVRDPAHGPIVGLLLALRYYCDPHARCLNWRRDDKLDT